jgi:hypothetical protein
VCGWVTDCVFLACVIACAISVIVWAMITHYSSSSVPVANSSLTLQVKSDLACSLEHLGLAAEARQIKAEVAAANASIKLSTAQRWAEEFANMLKAHMPA